MRKFLRRGCGMMKSSEIIIIVDSVEEAIKFYTEKLAFDVVELSVNSHEPNTLAFARLKKGKSIVAFRVPQVEELAEFSFIKRCASRCLVVDFEMKKGLEKYYQRCLKKGLKVVNELKDAGNGFVSFAVRDPFGTKLVFEQPVPGSKSSSLYTVAGLTLTPQDFEKSREGDTVDRLIDHLRGFGLLRRASKKFAKHAFKLVLKAKK